MTTTSLLARPYAVTVDHATLAAHHSGQEGTDYRVRVVGEWDERWVHAFRIVKIDDPQFSEFEIDSETGAVSFRSANGEGAVAVISMLDTLDSLVALINHNASLLAGRG